MSSRIEQIIEEIEEYVESCKYQPLSTTKIVVNKEELEKLIEFGVDYLQGYYFSRAEFTPPEISNELVEEVLKINQKLKNSVWRLKNMQQ